MGRDAETLARARRASLIAPAGFGKTHLIAEAVTQHCDRHQLLLTHTHAGVRAMVGKLAAMRCPPGRYRVETISGWALRFTTSYPGLAGVCCPRPTSSEWRQIYKGAAALLESKAVRHVVAASYAGMLVDEYQDCTKSQHQLILRLAEIVPCRVLGDPLQGIFDFEGEPLDWAADVDTQFETLPQLQTPHRWRNKNDHLGEWLREVRRRLELGDAIDLRRRPSGVYWAELDPKKSLGIQLQMCLGRAKLTGTIAAIHAGHLEGPCHFLARRLGGRFQSMEPVECGDLHKWATRVEQTSGGQRAAHLIDFAVDCLAGVKDELKSIRARLLKPPAKRGAPLQKHLQVLAALQLVASSSSMAPAITALDGIRDIAGAVMFRRELWEALRQALREVERGEHASLADAAWAVRDRVRRHGRAAETRTVSRTLLVKGLEYDHAIVLDADKLGIKELYVAMTRGSRSLTVLSAEPMLRAQ